MPRKGTSREAIRQGKPFRSRRQEAVIALILCAEAVRARYADVFSGDDLTLQQYNVLRILRGAGERGLPTLEIGERMLERTPGITRLIDRLVAKKLVARARNRDDRRQVWCRITAAGRNHLARYDTPVEALDDQVFAGLPAADTARLIELLDRVRNQQP